MIDIDSFDFMINTFNLGTSTAEKDPLLETAKIETQEFYDLDTDRIDIVRGIKGAGKTALYRLMYFLRDYMVKNDNRFCIFGVEATGDPVFLQFRDRFEHFSNVEFENFWILYLLLLIRSQMENNEHLKIIIQSERERLDALWDNLGVPLPGKQSGLYQFVKQIISKFRGIKSATAGIAVKQEANGELSYTPEITAEFDASLSEKPKYISDVKTTLCDILSKYKIKIWVMLDRLDEVFPRRTKQEEYGLKGLLKAAYNLSEKELRIKIFLRDDIIEQLASSSEGFTALTHVTDRSTATMSWSRSNILFLIVKRVFSHDFFVSYFGIDVSLLEKEPRYREECFYKIFPQRVGKLATLDWIMNVLSDGNGIVTPRDVIDLFNIAKSIQFKEFQIQRKEMEHLLNPESFKDALEKLSKEKHDKFLIAEFPHMRENIIRLEDTYSIHNSKSLEKIYGSNWKTVASDFKSIGLLEHDPKKNYYRIPKLWVKGMRVTQGKAKECD